MFVETLGWVAGAYGACVAMPQVARVARTRTTAGISLFAWQSSLSACISWTAYGLLTGHLNLWLPSLLLMLCGAWMLIMVARGRSVAPSDYPRIFALPIMVAVATITMAITAGPLAFSAVVFIPSAVAQMMHLRTLLRSPDFSAVSLPFLVMGMTGQLLWFSWGVLAGDVSNKLVGGSLAVLASANLVGYALRKLDLVHPAGGSVTATVDPLIGDPAVADLPVEAPSVEELLPSEPEADDRPLVDWPDLDGVLTPALARA